MAPRQVVVDGSNIATEGRSTPSLAQLDQAVREFLVEYPDAIVTVVVDASFAHRIDASELNMYEEAEAAGEVVSPPAGAIGRGDAFLLRIADKTGAMVLSNDSFQEFHGEHAWLFDKGRLIGGKPVPGVGWIFTPRTPVRGPKSREAVKEAKRRKKGDDDPRVEMPGLDLAAVRARSMGKEKKSVDKAIAVATEEAVAPNGSKRRRRRKGNSPPAEAVNDPLTFITFIAAHPLGSEVQATVESFASHGAFVEVEGARCYVPLSAMGSPAPKSAREVFAKGDEVRCVIQALDPQRRGIELALPGFANVAGAPTDETVEAEIAGDVASSDVDTVVDQVEPAPSEIGAPVRRTAGRRPVVKKSAGRRPPASAPPLGGADGIAAASPPPRRARAAQGDEPQSQPDAHTTPGPSTAAEPDRASAPAETPRSRADIDEVLAERRAARRARLAEEAAAQESEAGAAVALPEGAASAPGAAPARRSRRPVPAGAPEEPVTAAEKSIRRPRKAAAKEAVAVPAPAAPGPNRGAVKKAATGGAGAPATGGSRKRGGASDAAGTSAVVGQKPAAQISTPEQVSSAKAAPAKVGAGPASGAAKRARKAAAAPAPPVKSAAPRRSATPRAATAATAPVKAPSKARSGGPGQATTTGAKEAGTAGTAGTKAVVKKAPAVKKAAAVKKAPAADKVATVRKAPAAKKAPAADQVPVQEGAGRRGVGRPGPGCQEGAGCEEGAGEESAGRRAGSALKSSAARQGLPPALATMRQRAGFAGASASRPGPGGRAPSPAPRNATAAG